MPERLPGESSGARGVEVRPALVARPAQRRGRRAPRSSASWSLADPGQRRSFERNADAYLAKLRALDVGIARCMEQVPASRRKLVTDHDAFGYFADRYGIDVVGAVIPSQTTQAQPSAKDLTELADLIERERVEAIFPESSLSPKVAEAIADQTGATAELHALRRHARPTRAPTAPPTCGWRRPTRTRWSRGFTGGRRGCRLSP